MGDQMTVRPQFRVTAEVQRATSDCCGARLDVGPGGPGTFACQGCGQPCERVLSAPQEVELHG